MIDTIKKETPKEFLLRTLADPVLIYAVIAMMSIMNHYRSSLTLIYGITAYAAGWIVFRLFDYINKHHFIGFFAYIALFFLFVQGAREAIALGSRNYPISWGLWFLTPQDVLQYNKWYTMSIFILFLIFMLSVIYYFTRVRYRMFMNFLILIIPFSIYGKENEEMEIGYIMALCVGFIVILANFRQMSDTKDAETVDKPEMWKSATVFTVLFALVASLVPKPVVEADRTMIETLINAEALTDRFMSMLSVFQTESSGEQFRSNIADMVLYYAVSPTPLRLKTSTYTSYDYNKDSWRSSDTDSEYWFREDSSFDIYYDGGVAEAIIEAGCLDSSFAEKYGLEPYLQSGIVSPDKRKMTIFSVTNRGNSAPVPMGASELVSSTYDKTMGLTKAGTIFTDEGNFADREQFSFSYVLPSFFSNEKNKAFAKYTESIDDYEKLLYDAEDALWQYQRGIDESDEEKIEEIAHYRNVLTQNYDFYKKASENLLDYGNNQRIYELALEITEGLDSEYEKAIALEYYFINNDYVYDLDYQKAVGENAEDFLFKTKTGVCYEYATAMTLLARAAGIPARYCEGFNMQTKNGDENGDGYIVTTNDAHGFPELYLKGYGWMSFEPTMTYGDTQSANKSVTSLLSRTGLIILIFAVLALVLIFFMPAIVHRIFLVLVVRKTPNNAVSAVIRRICRIYGLSSATSVHEAESAVYQRSGADISTSAELFERAEYGGFELDETAGAKAVEDYISAYNALKEAKKAERKNNKRKHSKA